MRDIIPRPGAANVMTINFNITATAIINASTTFTTFSYFSRYTFLSCFPTWIFQWKWVLAYMWFELLAKTFDSKVLNIIIIIICNLNYNRWRFWILSSLTVRSRRSIIRSTTMCTVIPIHMLAVCRSPTIISALITLSTSSLCSWNTFLSRFPASIFKGRRLKTHAWF